MRLTWDECRWRSLSIAMNIVSCRNSSHIGFHERYQKIRLYGVPSGGIAPCLLVADELRKAGVHQNDIFIEEDWRPGVICIDDIVDSGATKEKYRQRDPDLVFHALVNNLEAPNSTNGNSTPGEWVSFPWERMKVENGPEDNVRRLLQYIGEDPNREGLKQTPQRVVKSYQTVFGGYGKEVSDILTTFEDGACDEMVILRDVEFYSHCEHHMMPFFGKAHIAYIPDGKVIGVSKLARVLEIYSRRLQIQERLTSQITGALDKHLIPKGSACVLEAKHFCMLCRGVEKQNSVMTTSSLTGAFRDAAVRSEFFNLIRSR